MLFNSGYFIIYFLPVVLLLYYMANRFDLRRVSLCILILASLVFYAFDNPYYLMLLVGSIAINWTVAYVINRGIAPKLMLIAGIVIDIGVIFYFKYFDFFLSNVNTLTGASFNLRHIMLPLGISFYTFQQISYLVDTYRGETRDYTFIEYAAFVSFFPQLVAGPIVLHSELISQFRDDGRRRIDAGRFAHGLYVFAIGLSKKVLLADRLGEGVKWVWQDVASRSKAELILGMLFYTFQLYFDFSGYCDMAVGIAGMFNLELPVNFNSPYKALSINDFWKRWHMTLTRFLTRYVYIPLGGNRKGTVRTYINILLVFLVSGLWHGANWTFILWGALHGVLQVMNRGLDKALEKVRFRIPKAVAWFCTFLLVNLLWIMFYAPDVKTGMYVWGRILALKDFGIGAFSISPDLYGIFVNEEISFVLAALSGAVSALSDRFVWWYMVVYLVMAFICGCVCRNVHDKGFKPTGLRAVLAAFLFVYSVMSLSGVSTFLYSNF